MKFFLLVLLLFPQNIIAQAPKRELRAAWIATVFNIDWPSSRGLSVNQQKKEMIEILDTLENLKFNAAILQVKPTSDAFYESKLSPWSYYLTGEQGKNPGYDPLKFFIEEAQKRAIETHIWVNPYRLLNGEGLEIISPKHIARKNPHWVIEYNGRYYFDPGNPEVQNYVTKEILEIVNNYDIDALHMDDYFYPYKSYKNGKLVHFDDDSSFKTYGKTFKSRDDWRRDNVNTFVEKLYKSITEASPHVQLGISPFGVWRNKSKDPRGSETDAGQTNYDDLYADVLLWIDKGWVHYILPQIYWHFDTKPAPYGVLVKWWSDAVKDKVNLFIGLGTYKLGEQNWPASHLKEQIDFARKDKHVDGVSFYSAKWIVQDTKGIIDYTKKEIFPYFALPPQNPRGGQKPFRVDNFILKGKTLTWENNDEKLAHYYTLYRFKKGEERDIDNPKNIMGIVSAYKKLSFTIPNPQENETYGIVTVSRAHKESGLFTLEDSEMIKSLETLDTLIKK